MLMISEIGQNSQDRRNLDEIKHFPLIMSGSTVKEDSRGYGSCAKEHQPAQAGHVPGFAPPGDQG